MSIKSKFAIDKDIELLNTQIQTLARREADFQRLLDDLQKLKDEVSNEKLELEGRRIQLETQKEPINWLPTELLIQTFLSFVDFDFENPNYRPPVVISHVCMKWRAIALGTPRLWSRIILQGFHQPEVAQTFLLRSSRAPLEIDYCSSPEDRPTQECCHLVDLLAKTSHHFLRVETLALRCRGALPIVYLLPLINDYVNAFPQLHHLTLAITTANPNFVEAPSLIDREEAILNGARPTSSNSPLLSLRLEQIPLFNFPIAFIANLRSLELSYSPRKMHSTRHEYYLKMSSLCRFLVLTPLLEELILANAVPYFDVTLPPMDGISADGTDASLIQMHPVKLDHLKSIDWTYPYTGDVHRFLSMIDAPGMEKLDLWVEDLPPKRSDTLYVRGYLPTSSSHKYMRGVISYPALRDLSLQCAGEDTTACVLRKFSLPALEKVAFTNVDTAAREAASNLLDDTLPVFPRLESIFRDPRLPNLTHLTLSHFKISHEAGRAESVLGYMPFLTSLSVDSCNGVGRLMEALQEKVVGTLKGGTRRGVKVCPRLEALSFRGCQDLDFESLRAVVRARNGSADNLEGSEGHQQTVTRDVQQCGALPAEEPQMGRKIKPLRKLRRHGHGQELGLSASVVPSTNIASTIIAMQEAFQPAHIIYVRVANCKLVNKEDASSLRDLGVVDVVWAGSD